MEKTKRKTAIETIGDVPWGSHFCLFYQTKEDLTDILVPYFKAGLENNEFCMWVTSEPLSVEDAKSSLKRVVKNLDDYIEKGQIEILDYSQWYTKSGKFDADKVLQGWVEKENQAANRGFDGLRLTGNTCWLEKEDWRGFTAYEARIDRVIGQYRMLVLCTYSLDKCGASEVIDVVSNHELALIRRQGKWEAIQSAKRKRAEEAVRESEEHYRVLFDRANDGIFVSSLDGNLVAVNEAFARMHGYSAEEMQHMSLKDLDTPETFQRVPERMARLRAGEPLTFEVEHYHKDGHVFPLEVSASLISSGGTSLVQCFHRDIAERKRAEAALHESERKLRLITENADDVVYAYDIERRLLYVNPAVEQLTGYTVDELRERRFINWLYPEDEARMMKLWDSLFQGQAFSNQEFRIVTKSGQVKWCLSSWGALCDEQGQQIGIQGRDRDITERKRAEEALRDKEEFSRALFEYNPVVTVVVDREGKVTMSNRAKINSGQRLPNIGDVMYKDYAGNHERDMYGELMECIRSGRSKEFPELKYQQRLLAITIAPFPKGAIIVSQDITERKQAEERIQILSRFPAENPNPVLRIAPEGVILYANDASEPLLAAWNTQIGQVVPDDWRMQTAEVSKSGQRKEIEVRCGQQVFSCILAPMVSAGYVNVYGRDLTERKRAEEVLRVSHRFLEIANRSTEMIPLLKEFVAEVRNFTGCAAVGLRMLDAEGSIRYQAHEGFSQRFYESESPLSIRSDQCMCINVIKGTTNPKLSFYTEGGSFYMNGTTRFLATVSEEEKGQTRNVCNQFGYESVALVPIRLGDNILGLIHVADYQENMVPLEMVEVLEGAAMQLGTGIQRVRAEEALRESEARYRMVFEASADGILIADIETKVFKYVNPALCRMLGYTEEELRTMGVADIHPKEALQSVVAEFEAQARGDKTLALNIPCLRKDGTILHADINTFSITLGGRVCNVGFFRDITERKQAERELQEKSAALERFTYAISHDLKSPLVTVKTFLGYLEQDLLRSDTGRIEKDMFYMRTAADKMGRSLDELLKVLRIGHIANTPVRVTFRELVEEALNVVAGPIAERGVKVQVNDAPITLYGDRPRLVEIWQNLVENAVKFMGDQASPRIEIGAERRGGDTIFFVRDNGTGIDPRHQAKVFDLFVKIGAKSAGAGLGLALIKRIVELYRGTIWLESKGLGQGACFLFTLPGAVQNQG